MSNATSEPFHSLTKEYIIKNINPKDITKEYIKENVLNKKGNLNPNVSRFLPVTKEDLYLIYHNKEKPTCRLDSCLNYPKFKSFSSGYYDFCSGRCVQLDKEIRDKRQDTLFERYGTRDSLEINEGRKKGIKYITSEENLRKLELNNIKKFGGKTSFSSQDVQDKCKKTNLLRYGFENPMHSEEFINNTFIPILNTKRKQTYIKRFGFSHHMKNQEMKDKVRILNETKGRWITEDKIKDFKDYSKLVWRYTNQNNLIELKNINLRSTNYHLDHKYSIFQGFKDNISASIIGNICNLEILSGKENRSKNIKCSQTKESLLKSYKNKEIK